jgi:release factor glutamine methyltransferase
MNKEEVWLLSEKYGGVAGTAYEADVARVRAGEPLAYVINWQPFLGLTIHLDSKPLIPRPETEWWTEQMIEESLCATSTWSGLPGEAEIGQTILHDIPRVRFLDLCTGSGAIGCAVLARIPNAEVFFGEIDPAHKTTIERNIRENHLDERRAHIGIGDLFAPFAGMTFDVIAINPPYIPSERVLDDGVAKFEPHQALFSGIDGLDLISRIARELSAHLAKGGTAWIECDSSNITSAKALFAEQGFVTKIRTDQYDVPRILVVSLS